MVARAASVAPRRQSIGGCLARVLAPLRSARCLTRPRPTPADAAAANVELAQRVAHLELQQQQRGAHVFSPTAAAKTYRNAVDDRVVMPSPAVTWFQPIAPPDAVLDALRTQPLAPDAPESLVLVC